MPRLRPTSRPYTLDTGDKLRVVVFGQDGITNSYTVDAGGNVNLPLIGAVPARGLTTNIGADASPTRLKQGYVREPHVSVEVETYRPFFILGEVTNPGPVSLRRQHDGGERDCDRRRLCPARLKTTSSSPATSPVSRFKRRAAHYPLRPGDTIVVKERWF